LAFPATGVAGNRGADFVSAAIGFEERIVQPDNNFTEIRPSASLIERAQRLWAVNSMALEIRDDAKIKGTELENDFRLINQLIRQHTILLTVYDRCANNAPVGIELLGLTDVNSLPSIIRNMTNLDRIQFATMMNFFIESFLRKYIRKNNASPKFSYSKLVRQALKIAGIFNNSNKDAMVVLSMIRNTLHDAGAHTHNSQSIDLQGVTYSFVQGDYVKGDAGWDQIAHAANCILRVIKKIIGTLP
jgi:hypothetical protein